MNYLPPFGDVITHHDSNSATEPQGAEAIDRRLLTLIDERASDDDFWSPKDRDRGDSAHCIFQYPAMMVPLVQRRLLASILEAKPSIQSLYDPFVGSGTSLVSGMHFGLGVYGNDVNPLAVLISRVRTARVVESAIGAIVDQVVREATGDCQTTIDCTLPNRQKWFHDVVSVELSRLRRAIRRQPDLWVRRFLWVTLAETVRLTSNDRTSTYKLHARPVEEITKRILSPIKLFGEIGAINAESFADFRIQLHARAQLKAKKYRAETEVKIGDTRDLSASWNSRSFDLVMTSPPYGDNMTTVTYGQHSYLPLNWIDYRDIDSAADIETLRTTQEIDRRSLGGWIHDKSWSEERLLDSSPALRNCAGNLPAVPAGGRARLLRFYTDFAASLDSITKLTKPNGYMVWTVGNRSIGGRQVPTDLILSEMLSTHVCTVLKTLTRKIHHKRMPGRNASSPTMREERILLVRKLER